MATESVSRMKETHRTGHSKSRSSLDTHLLTQTSCQSQLVSITFSGPVYNLPVDDIERYVGIGTCKHMRYCHDIDYPVLVPIRDLSMTGMPLMWECLVTNNFPTYPAYVHKTHMCDFCITRERYFVYTGNVPVQSCLGLYTFRIYIAL